MNINFYKKSGIVVMYLARDFFAMRLGEKIPTIAEYTERLTVSRGIVQNAIALLEEEGCICIEKRGAKGTILVGMETEKLYPYTNWGSITGTMPIPLNPYLSSLTTAICEEMETAPFPFSFAYVTGSEKRLEKLKEMMYDFIIVSKSTAQSYLKAYDYLTCCMNLNDCTYSAEYVLYFFDETKCEIEDGMRVAIDRKCYDQAALTEKLCEGKKVELVDFPYIAFEDVMKMQRADCVVYRVLDGWAADQLKLRSVKLDTIKGFSDKETKTPVILTHKDNYGIERLLRQYINEKNIRILQEEVLNGRSSMKFY